MEPRWYSTIDAELNLFPSFPNIPNFIDTYTNASIDLILEYDARDNTLSPTSGYFINLKSSLYREALGSENDFERYISNGYFYLPATDTLNVNMKITAESISGEEAPFYSYPFVSLRGMPMMKVLGQHVLNSELELCWNFDTRWEALLFGGIGKAFGDNAIEIGQESFSDSKNHFTQGIGFRYLIARKFGLKMGVDVASSEFDNAFYIQFGSAWAGF